MKVKKVFLTLFLLLCSCSVFLVAAGATDSQSGAATVTRRTDFEDGSYVIEEITEDATPIMARATSSKSGTKNATYYNSSNTAIFGVKVTGSFSYNGSSAWATASSATVYIYDSSASYVSKSATYSGNSASATGKAKYNYVTVPLTTTLYCSKNGALS